MPIQARHEACGQSVWDNAGKNIIEHLAGVEDFEAAEATYRAAVKKPVIVREIGRVAGDAAFDAHARDRFAIQRLSPMQRQMIEYQRIAGRQLGRDAIRRREMLADPFVRVDPGFGWRQLTHAPMRAAHQLDRGLLAADGRQRQPYIE